MTRRPARPWIVIDYSVQPPEWRCDRCGARVVLALPKPVAMVIAEARAFEKEHKGCR